MEGNDIFELEFTSRTPGLQIEIVNSTGKQITRLNSVRRFNTLDLSDVPSGNYVLHVSDEARSTERQIVIRR